MDSTAILTAANLGLQAQLELAKQTIQAQQNLTTTSITVLAVIVAVLAGATWLWNFVLNRRHIESQIRKATGELKAAVAEAVKAQVSLDMSAMKAELKQDITLLSAERARLFSALNVEKKDWQAVCLHASQAATLYQRAKDDEFVRFSVDVLKEAAEMCTWMKPADKKIVLAALDSVPPLLQREKEAIVAKVSGLPDEEPPK